MVKKIVASSQGQLCFSKRFISYLSGRTAHGVLDGCLIANARATLAMRDEGGLEAFIHGYTPEPGPAPRLVGGEASDLSVHVANVPPTGANAGADLAVPSRS